MPKNVVLLYSDWLQFPNMESISLSDDGEDDLSYNDKTEKSEKGKNMDGKIEVISEIAKSHDVKDISDSIAESHPETKLDKGINNEACSSLHPVSADLTEAVDQKPFEPQTELRNDTGVLSVSDCVDSNSELLSTNSCNLVQSKSPSHPTMISLDEEYVIKVNAVTASEDSNIEHATIPNTLPVSTSFPPTNELVTENETRNVIKLISTSKTKEITSLDNNKVLALSNENIGTLKILHEEPENHNILMTNRKLQL